eukprot:Ihof_evm7s39 gene=Ihof_evmTU7s39
MWEVALAETKKFLNIVSTQPMVLIRLLQWIFAAVVFGCITDRCKPEEYCVFNNSGACNFGIGLGVFTFLISAIFLVADVYGHENFALMRKPFAKLEAVVNIAIAFLWFVSFCFLTDQWRKDRGPPAFFPTHHWSSRVINNAQGAIIFALLSLIAWIGSSAVVYARYKAPEQDFPTYNPPVNTYEPYQSNEPATTVPQTSYQ